MFTACMPMSALCTVILTVISGVTVFVLGQLILKGILEPALCLKDRIAEICKQLHLLVHQRSSRDDKYAVDENDIKVTGELAAEIHSLTCRILLVYGNAGKPRIAASAHSCPPVLSRLFKSPGWTRWGFPAFPCSKFGHYLSGLLRYFLGLPSLEELQEASNTLNKLSYGLRECTEIPTDKRVNVQELQERSRESSRKKMIEELIPKIEELLRIPQTSPSKNAQAAR